MTGTTTVWRKSRALWLSLVAATIMGALLLAANPAHAATTFTVNSTGDENDLDFPGGTFDGSSDGKCDVDSSTAGNQCTLRAAIQQANKKKGKDTIAFNIPGNGPHNIPLGSLGLPTITKPVTIDGYTQGDATADTADDATENTIPLAKGGTNADLRIQLDGTNVTSAGRGLGIDASNTLVKGLVINRFRREGIFIDSGSDGNRIEGNFIGTDPSGFVDVGNGTEDVGAVPNAGVTVFGGTNNTIGGASPEARNLISGNDDGGVAIADTGARGNKIEGNLIGTDRNGTDLNLGNSPEGVHIRSGPTNNTVGDNDPSDGATNAANIIAFNTGNGVLASNSTSTGNRILSNSIFSNGQLGIDLDGGSEDANGVTANDDTSTPPDSDTGPNRLQNYPTITSAQVFNELFGKTTTITGELTSTPSTRKKKRTFTIQFFSSPEADPSGFGEGKTFLGQIKVRTDRKGVARDAFGNPGFTFTANGDLSDQYVTATATNNKTGDTSEFSQARVVQGPVIGL